MKVTDSKNKTERTNTGRKHKKNPQSAQALVMMGKGQFATMRAVSGPSLANMSGPPFDKVQSEINRELGYW